MDQTADGSPFFSRILVPSLDVRFTATIIPLGGVFARRGHGAPHGARHFVDYTKHKPIHNSPHKRTGSQGVSKTDRGVVSGALMRPHNPGGWAKYLHGARTASAAPP